MSGYLLDTNVISEFNRRGDPDPAVRLWLEAADTSSLYITSACSHREKSALA